MFAFRCIALLALSGAEEWVELDEASALLQGKTMLKRQEASHNETNAASSHLSESMATLKTVHASASSDEKTVAVEKEAGGDATVTSSLLDRAKGTADASSVGFGNCDVDRTMKSKGPQNFAEGKQTSIVTGIEYQFADEDEFAILDKINEVRQAGFNCTDLQNDKVHVFKPKCRSKDIIFDCRLWFAAKQHSEDMGKRNYYAHETKSPFPSNKSGSRETFDQRVKAYAWGVAAHKEVIMGISSSQKSTADLIVESWLGSYEQCMALGTNDAHLMGIGQAPCQTESGRCMHHIAGFTDALMSRRGGLLSYIKPSTYKLDTSCYPDSRDKQKR